MLIDTSTRIAFLNRIHLFYGLTEDQLKIVAEALTEEKIPTGKEIIKQGTEGGCLYLLWSGKVSITQEGKEQPLAMDGVGNYFGEESLLVKQYHWAFTATAADEAVLLVFRREQFTELVKEIGILNTNIAVTVNSHRLDRRLRFKWVQPGEVVHFLSRKHPILLAEALQWPAVIGFIAVIGMLATWYYSLWYPIMIPLWYLALFFGILAIGWGVWNSIDWGNDYYIVTDRRVVWLEKVIGIYDSRQESPLSAIQRVNVETDFSGRLLDYGDLVIQTIVGTTLKLRNVDHPNQAAALIDQYWKRSRETSRKMDAGEIDQALHARLLDGEEKFANTKGIIAEPKDKKNPYQDQRGLANLFRQRFEHLSVVTYRKHLFVLFKQTFFPGLFTLALLGILIYEIFTPSTGFSEHFNIKPDAIILVWLILFFIAVLWGVYEYLDWRNDIFQVTHDQIMDIDKTPLGRVTSDIASLDNILSIEYKRIGILELLFNYGTVYITIGGGKEMAFENVFNPSAVQEDIERRRLERISQKEQESIRAERERVADWFAAYFHNEEKFRSEESNGDDKTLEDKQPQNDVK
jgi:hypothetical protein